MYTVIEQTHTGKSTSLSVIKVNKLHAPSNNIKISFESDILLHHFKIKQRSSDHIFFPCIYPSLFIKRWHRRYLTVDWSVK